MEQNYIPTKEAEAIIDGYRLLDDNFMTMVFDQNFEAMALVLNIILERKDIMVKNIEIQKTEKNSVVGGRDLRIDIFAVDSSGKYYNIEVQRADEGADIKRARFLSAVLDSRMLKAGDDFKDLNESYVIFITENDVLGGGDACYFIERKIRNSEISYEDGNHIVYVNGAFQNDDTDIGKLMHDFRCTKSENMYYNVLRDGVSHFKDSEGGRKKMCKALEEYGDKRELEGRIEGKIEGKIEGMIEGKIETSINLYKAGMDIDFISKMTNSTREEVENWIGIKLA